MAHDVSKVAMAMAAAPRGMRVGQVAFNVVHTLYPDLADEFRNTDIDPFYNDEKTQAFLKACEEKGS